MATSYGVAAFNDSTPGLDAQQFSNPLIPWKLIEPSEGVYELNHDASDPIEQALLQAATEGKKAIIRLAIANWANSSIGGGTQASPSWLFSEAGMEAYGSVDNPRPSNAVYQAKYEALLEAIAAEYDGDPRIEYLQCSLGGVYGEMYIGSTAPSGWNATEQEAALQWHIDTWHVTFPNTPKAAMLNTWAPDSADDDMADYIAGLGWILQTNSPLANSVIRGWMNAHSATNKIAVEAEDSSPDYVAHPDWAPDDDQLPGFQAKWEDMAAAYTALDYVLFESGSFSHLTTRAYIEATVYPALRTDGPEPHGSTPLANPNLLANPGADDNLNNITSNGTGTSILQDTTHVRSGSHAVKTTTGTAASSGVAYRQPSGQGEPAVEYNGSAYFYHEGGATVGMRIILSFRDAGGAVIGSEAAGAIVNVPGSTWTRVDHTATSPANTAAVWVKAVRAPTSAVTFWTDDAKLEESPTPTAFVPDLSGSAAVGLGAGITISGFKHGTGAVAMSIGAAPDILEPDNVVSNPGVETGTNSGWFRAGAAPAITSPQNNPAFVRTGSWSMRHFANGVLTGTGPAARKLDATTQWVKPGEEVVVSMWTYYPPELIGRETWLQFSWRTTAEPTGTLPSVVGTKRVITQSGWQQPPALRVTVPDRNDIGAFYFYNILDTPYSGTEEWFADDAWGSISSAGPEKIGDAESETEIVLDVEGERRPIAPVDQSVGVLLEPEGIKSVSGSAVAALACAIAVSGFAVQPESVTQTMQVSTAVAGVSEKGDVDLSPDLATAIGVASEKESETELSEEMSLAVSVNGFANKSSEVELEIAPEFNSDISTLKTLVLALTVPVVFAAVSESARIRGVPLQLGIQFAETYEVYKELQPTDVVAAVLDILSDAGIATRVYGSSLPDFEAKDMPRSSVVITRVGGGSTGIGARSYVRVNDVRLDIRCYAPSASEADILWKLVHQKLKQWRGGTINGCAVYSFSQEGGPTDLIEPETEWPFVLATYGAIYSEVME